MPARVRCRIYQRPSGCKQSLNRTCFRHMHEYSFRTKGVQHCNAREWGGNDIYHNFKIIYNFLSILRLGCGPELSGDVLECRKRFLRTQSAVSPKSKKWLAANIRDPRFSESPFFPSSPNRLRFDSPLFICRVCKQVNKLVIFCPFLLLLYSSKEGIY